MPLLAGLDLTGKVVTARVEVGQAVTGRPEAVDRPEQDLPASVPARVVDQRVHLAGQLAVRRRRVECPAGASRSGTAATAAIEKGTWGPDPARPVRPGADDVISISYFRRHSVEQHRTRCRRARLPYFNDSDADHGSHQGLPVVTLR